MLTPALWPGATRWSIRGYSCTKWQGLLVILGLSTIKTCPLSEQNLSPYEVVPAPEPRLEIPFSNITSIGAHGTSEDAKSMCLVSHNWQKERWNGECHTARASETIQIYKMPLLRVSCTGRSIACAGQWQSISEWDLLILESWSKISNSWRHRAGDI